MAFERIIRTQTTIIACQDGSSIVWRVALRVVSYRTMQVTTVKTEEIITQINIISYYYIIYWFPSLIIVSTAG